MSRDTWDPARGSRESIGDLARVWRQARERGATGLTVSGGEPAEQSGEVAELVHRIRQADAELTQDGRAQGGRAGAERPLPLDVLVFSGLDEVQFRATSPALAECADAAVLGPFDITQPTDLIWRGSANQRLVSFTALGAERYVPYREAATASPAVQFVIDADRIWTIGIPRIGDMPALERRLREHGVEVGRVSWRP
jgi:anaerobic ribonucleoside-triphosphate reductase activating protein